VKYFATVDERLYECTIEAADGRLFVEMEGRRYEADLQHLPRARSYSLILDGRSFEFTLHEGEEAIECSGAAGLFHVRVEDARTHAARSKTADARGPRGVRLVKATMPGIVREVLVEEGQTIEKGQALLILEAMKMQNEILADREGTVKAIHVAGNDTVDKNAKLIELE
jgi:biotin carboxyl carrier protein